MILKVSRLVPFVVLKVPRSRSVPSSIQAACYMMPTRMTKTIFLKEMVMLLSFLISSSSRHTIKVAWFHARNMMMILITLREKSVRNFTGMPMKYVNQRIVCQFVKIMMPLCSTTRKARLVQGLCIMTNYAISYDSGLLKYKKLVQLHVVIVVQMIPNSTSKKR